MTQRGPEDRRDEEVRDQEARDPADDADVILDVPVLNVEELNLEVEDLRAHISARAELAGFLSIDVGVSAYVDNLKLSIKGVEAQVKLDVKLERILGSIDRALEAIDNNPQILDPDLRRSRGDQNKGGEGPRELPAGTEGVADEPAEGPVRDGAEPGATGAARKKADELGLDLSGIEGTGSGGRILIRDVEQAARR